MSETLHFAEHRMQEVALVIMATVYTLRLIWLFRFKAGRDRSAPAGTPGRTSAKKGAYWSLAMVAMPWAMESSRTRPLYWTQFAIFHLGVTSALGLSFVIPYAPGVLAYPAVTAVLQGFLGVAFLIGLYRVGRRFVSPRMRTISSPDDYFSLIMITAWLGLAFLAVPNDISKGETLMLAYFYLTAFFIIYVPFSKISHYLYYPFTRWWMGKALGHRGVFPMVKSAPGYVAAGATHATQKVPVRAEA